MGQGAVSISQNSIPLESDVSLPTGLRLRNGVWQLRIGVPADLVHLYSGIDAYRGSLKTRDRAEAITKAHALIAQHRQTFDTQRTAEVIKRAPPLVPLTPDLEAFLTAKAARRPLALDDDIRVEPDPVGLVHLPPGEMLRRWHNLQQDVLAMEKADIAAGRLDTTQAHAVADLADLGIRVVWDSLEARKALLRIARARVKAYQLAVERSAGEPHDTPLKPVAPTTAQTPREPDAPSVTLRDVMPDWVTRTKAKVNAQQRTSKALALWEEAVGTVALQNVSRATGAAYVAFLLDSERPFGSSTAANHAAAINALMNIAVKMGKVDRNPLDLSFKITDAERRYPWTSEELSRIFDSSLFSESPPVQPWDVDPADARLWLWLLLWSGATAGEIA